MASESFNVNKRVTSLKLTGGVDADPKRSEFPDLYVKGGARIRKTLRMGDAHISNNVDVKGNIATDVISEFTPDSGVLIEGVLLKDGSVYGNVQGNIVSTFPTGQSVITNTNSSVTVNTSDVKTSSLVFLTLVNPDPSGPVVSVGTITDSTSFVINSDTSAGVSGITVNWAILG
jgi:hypothetical protein